ncbi:hypothetical protein ABT354_21180 [Streptomyces sp. NPDC000594]|uniref:SCO2195 family GlnR-regulated protein n=1 Tax=Streptomyces sp. NPDC000594 TaxID=3154261 RepID=UPI003324234F
MQAAPVRPIRPVPSVGSARLVRAQALPSVTGALRAMESLLLGGGQRTARRNAWTAVLEDRRRAKDRVETQHVLEAVAGRGPAAT